MFVDKVELIISSGKGGAGCSSFHREKFIIRGGPDGGDGGKGGDVYFRVDNNTDTLSGFKGKKTLKADNGKNGMTRKKYGKYGENLYIRVPPGTQVIDIETDEVLLDLMEDGLEIKFLEGGKGGLGNTHFKSSTNQQPTYCQPGLEGIEKKIRLELKLIADVGLVGFPNVGKSTLISTISHAHPEVANYEFTTLTPKLGVVTIGDYNSFVMADIPGIIEGASDGKGLGLQFLKHIERTETLLFMIDLANYRDVVTQYKTLRKELNKYSETLYKRKFAIVLTKADAVSEEEKNEKVEKFIKSLNLEVTESDKYKFKDLKYIQLTDEFSKLDVEKPLFISTLSAVVGLNIEPVKYALYDLIKLEK